MKLQQTYIFWRLVLLKNDTDFILVEPSDRKDTIFPAELIVNEDLTIFLNVMNIKIFLFT